MSTVPAEELAKEEKALLKEKESLQEVEGLGK